MLETFYFYILVPALMVLIFELVCSYILFEKLDISGYKALIPIYNIYVLFKLTNSPGWMFILALIPIVNIYIFYLISLNISERLGRSKKDAILFLIFFIVMNPVYAFSKSKATKEYVNQEEIIPNQQLMDGPIEPLGAIPDIEEEVVEEVKPVEIHQAVSHIAQSIIDEPVLDPVEGIIQMDIEDPMALQAKAMLTEDEKEVYPDVNIFKTCPNCGNKLEPNATACFLCGKRLDEEN